MGLFRQGGGIKYFQFFWRDPYLTLRGKKEKTQKFQLESPFFYSGYSIESQRNAPKPLKYAKKNH